jgi:hypothetical protein
VGTGFAFSSWAHEFPKIRDCFYLSRSTLGLELLLKGDKKSIYGCRRPRLQAAPAPMRPLLVVVAEVLSEYPVEVAPPGH